MTENNEKNSKVCVQPGPVIRSGTPLRVRTGVKAGGTKFNHGTPLRVRTGVKAGGTKLNHGTPVRS